MSIENYSIYETASGNIRQWGTCGVGEGALIELEAGQGIIYGSGGPWATRTHYVSAGVPVAYTAEQAAAKSARPKARGFVWSNSTMAWDDVRTLAQAKAQKRQELATAWKASMESGVTIGGKVALTNSEAWVDYLTLRLMAQEAGWVDTPIELADGSFELLTQAKAAALWDALKALRRTQMTKLRNKMEQVRNALLVEDVILISWDHLC